MGTQLCLTLESEQRADLQADQVGVSMEIELSGNLLNKADDSDLVLFNEFIVQVILGSGGGRRRRAG